MSATAQTVQTEYSWQPQLGPQKALIDCPIPKSVRGPPRWWQRRMAFSASTRSRKSAGSGFNAVFFRKEMPQQDDLIERAKEIYLSTGARWRTKRSSLPCLMAAASLPTARERDRCREYQGQSLSDAAVEEAGNYRCLRRLIGSSGVLRSAHGVPIQLLLSANPGGPGHQWIKQRFMIRAPLGMSAWWPVAQRQEHHSVLHSRPDWRTTVFCWL